MARTDLNAQTGLDETMYFWSMPENRLELWAWLESSRLANTVPREFYKERDRGAGGAAHAHRLQPHRATAANSFAATAYVAHNYGRSGVGWPSEVSQITATEAMAFHKKYYVGSNIVVAVVGDVKAAEAMPMLEKYFSKVPGGPKPRRHDDGRAEAVCREVSRDSDPAQPIYVEGYHRPSYREPDDAVYDAISDILSNGRVSRLYRSLVRDQQIAAEAAGFSPFPGDEVPQPLCIWSGAFAWPYQRGDARRASTKRLKS